MYINQTRYVHAYELPNIYIYIDFCVLVWCRDDYIKEAESQLKDSTIYKDVNFKETMLSDLVDKSNKFFKSLHSRKCITKKELKYFSYQFK